MSTRKRGTLRIAGNILIGLGGLILIASSAAKFAQVPMVVTALSALGIAGYKLTLVATLEMTSAVLLLIPSTGTAGLLLVSAFLGGAVATHLEHDQARASGWRSIRRSPSPSSGSASGHSPSGVRSLRLIGAELGVLALTFAGLVIEVGRRRIESTSL